MRINSLWLKNFQASKTFYEENGRFPTCGDDYKLYRWACQWWKKSYLRFPEKNRGLADMLMSIGYTFKTSEDRDNEIWLLFYQKAKDFYDRYGRFPIHKELPGVVEWARRWWQRKDADKDADKIRLLENIGFTYLSTEEKNDLTWERYYKEAKAFFDSKGRFPTRAENRNLCAWAYYWAKKGGQKHLDKLTMLKALGFEFRSLESMKDDVWLKYYRLASEFYRQNGRFPSRGDNLRLYEWVHDWFRRGGAAREPEKARKLEEIGFRYVSPADALDRDWDIHYPVLKSYAEEHGHLPTEEENPKLRRWLRRWVLKCYRREPEKYKEKADMLEAIGFNIKERS